MRVSVPKANYFPLRSERFVLSAGLHRLGHDFGNGPSDAAFFQVDAEHAFYQREKRRILAAHPERLRVASDPSAQRLLEHVK